MRRSLVLCLLTSVVVCSPLLVLHAGGPPPTDEFGRTYDEVVDYLDRFLGQMSPGYEQRVKSFAAHLVEAGASLDESWAKADESFEQRFEGMAPQEPTPREPVPLQAIPSEVPPPAEAPPEPVTERAPVISRPLSPFTPSEAHALRSDGARRFGTAVASAADRYELNPRFLLCVIGIESAYRSDAVSRAGAQGLMQLMPMTADELGVDNPFDITANILGGARLIDQHLTSYDEDVRLAMAAYNAGPGAVRKYGGVPPYSETQAYVTKIVQTCGSARM